MKPAADTHPRTSAPAPPDQNPRQPERPAPDLPGTGSAPPGHASTFPGRADQVSQVRREIAAYLGNCPAAADMVLIVSELVTNAILHTQSRNKTFTVRCQLSPRAARIEVEDLGGPGGPGRPATGPTG